MLGRAGTAHDSGAGSAAPERRHARHPRAGCGPHYSSKSVWAALDAVEARIPKWDAKGKAIAEPLPQDFVEIRNQIHEEVNPLPDLSKTISKEEEEADNKSASQIPTFQGGKTKVARAATAYIRNFLGDHRLKITEINDYFGGSGGWGLHLARRVFPNVKKINIMELDPARVEKINFQSIG